MKKRILALGAAGLLFGAGLSVGCDSNALLSTSERSFREIFVLGAVPMKIEGSGSSETYVPVCDGANADVDGLILKSLFYGSEVKDEVVADLDLSIRPGDNLDRRFVDEDQINTSNFRLSFDCIEQVLLQDRKCVNSGDCEADQTCGDRIKGYCIEDGVSVPYCYSQIKSDSVALTKIGFKPITPARGTSVGVAILVDMSGSNSGLVHYYPPYYEDTMGDATASIPEGATFLQNGSDPGGTRLAAVKEVIETLNAGDKVVVFSFNENKIDIVCNHPDKANASFEEKKEACFSSNKTLVLGDAGSFSPLEGIRNDSLGRTPLWSAVDMAYDYMANHAAAKNLKYKHILVISDGPDTCSDCPELNRCRKSCLSYQTTYEQAMTRIRADEYKDRIPVHFVQFAAKGYPDRDSRQMQTACETGGNYVFLNAQDFTTTELANHLKDAAKRVRYTFGGYWEMVVKLDAIKNNNDMPQGWAYAVEGKLSVSEPMFIADGSEKPYPFNIDTSTYLDGRPAIHKNCTTNEDCDEAETMGTCATRTWFCDTAAGACKFFDAWTDNGTGQGECKPVKAYLKLQPKNTNSSSAGDTITKQLGASIPTVCCSGGCVPPKPPVMPAEYADSTIGGKCYEEQGWKPDDKDPSIWYFWAVYYVNKSGCTTHTAADAADQMAYSNPGGLDWPDDWSCEDTENCFHP
jgi:hypothetical protein